MAYFITCIVLVVLGYLFYHNRKKVGHKVRKSGGLWLSNIAVTLRPNKLIINLFYPEDYLVPFLKKQMPPLNTRLEWFYYHSDWEFCSYKKFVGDVVPHWICNLII